MNICTVLKCFLMTISLIDEYFLISVKDDCISEKDYLQVIDIWIVSEMNTMGDYHDLHLKTKVDY